MPSNDERALRDWRARLGARPRTRPGLSQIGFVYGALGRGGVDGAPFSAGFAAAELAAEAYAAADAAEARAEAAIAATDA